MNDFWRSEDWQITYDDVVNSIDLDKYMKNNNVVGCMGQKYTGTHIQNSSLRAWLENSIVNRKELIELEKSIDESSALVPYYLAEARAYENVLVVMDMLGMGKGGDGTP